MLKNDKYKKSRSGPSRLLDISCAKCSSHIFFYQKDGVGMLKRCYVDRIIDPTLSVIKVSKLICGKCGELIGIPIVYKKENRDAIRLVPGAISKKIKSIGKRF